jgi:hypothetical protein
MEFSYFDQYKDVTIDLTPYITYMRSCGDPTYTLTNIQSVTPKLKNIFDKIELISSFENDILNFTFYNITEGERPENVAYNVYGDVEKFWLVLIFNRITNVFKQWPLTQTQLYDVANRLSTTEAKYTLNTYYQLLFEKNEQLRRIRLIKPTFVGQVITKFRNEFEKSNI